MINKKKKQKNSLQKLNIRNREELTEIYCKSDVLILVCVFEKYIKVSVNEFGINPLYCVSLPGYFFQCGLKCTGINLQTLQVKDMILLLENNISGGICSVMADRYVKSDENKKIIYIDAHSLYGHSMSQPLPYDEIKFEGNDCLNEILITPDNSDIGCFLEVDLRYPYSITQKTTHFPFCPENKSISKDDFRDYMKKIKSKNYISHNKSIFDWTDRNKYLVHYKLLKIYVRHGMLMDKVHEKISFKQSKWLVNNINFITQERNQAVKGFEKAFYNKLNNAFYGKTMENVRNRCTKDFIKKDETDKNIKQQP